MSAQPIHPRPTTPEVPGLEAQIQRLLFLYRQEDEVAYGLIIEHLIKTHDPQLMNALRGGIFGSMIKHLELDQPSVYDEILMPL